MKNNVTYQTIKKNNEKVLVRRSHTIVDPRTVMVKHRNAFLANITMFRPNRFYNTTLRTNLWALSLFE
jgi:hypothetical protein